MTKNSSASLCLSDRSLRPRRLISAVLEAVPDPPLGEDQLGLGGIALELLAQVTDVHVDRALVAVLGVAEHVLEQLDAREDAPVLARQRHQDLELEERQLAV